MQFRDKTAYVWGLCYRWDPSLSRNPVPRFPHFMPPWSELNLRLLVYFEITQSGVALFPLMIGKNLKLKKYFWYYQDCHWWHSLNIHHKKFDLRWTWGTQIWNHCIDISNFPLIELDATKIVNVSPRNFNAFPRKPVTQWSKTWFQLNFIILSKVKLFP